MDIIARIRKGDFPGADDVLFGTLTSLQFRDSLSPIQQISLAESGMARQMRPTAGSRAEPTSPTVPPAKTEAVTTLR